MKEMRVVGIVLALALLAVPVLAGDAEEVTVEGKIACAKCTLQLKDATECQDVLVVDGGKDAEPTYYRLVKNDVAKEFGHVCMGEKGARVTGTVAEKDGQMWLTPTKMEQVES